MKKAMLLLLTLALLVSGGALADEAYPETVDLTLYRAIFSASPIGTPIEEEWANAHFITKNYSTIQDLLESLNIDTNIR